MFIGLAVLSNPCWDGKKLLQSKYEGAVRRPLSRALKRATT